MLLAHCLLTGRDSWQGLTLPYSSPGDVDPHWEGGVERLVKVDNEDVTSRSVNPGRVHRCILGNKTGTHKVMSSKSCFSKTKEEKTEDT